MEEINIKLIVPKDVVFGLDILADILNNSFGTYVFYSNESHLPLDRFYSACTVYSPAEKKSIGVAIHEVFKNE